MRDAAGNGNIYFDDVFSNGIPILSQIFWCLNGTIGCINLILAPIFFYNACLKQSYHRNLRVVSSNIYLAFFCSGLGNGVTSIMVLCHVSDKGYDFLFMSFRFIHTLGPAFLKMTFLAIILERTAATVFCRSYENRAPLIFALILYLSEFLGASYPVAYYILRVHHYIVVGIHSSINVICLMSALVLFQINKKMRQKRFDTTIHLSYRYQINENLRFLRILTPLIILAVIVDTIAMIGYMIQSSIDFKTNMYYPLYLLITNAYVPVFYALYLKRDERTRRKIFGFLNWKTAIVEPVRSPVRNVIGEPLVIKDDIEIHFMQLEKLWA